VRVVLLAAERQQVIMRLQELTQALRNVLGGAAGVPPGELRRSFLRWMSEAEVFFRSSFVSVEPPIEFDSPRLVALQGDRIAADQIYVVLQAEGARLIAQLEAAVVALTTPLPASAHGPDRIIVVLDTNTLLHYRKPDEISWRVLTGAPEVLLVVPLVVLDELDDKRNAPVSHDQVNHQGPDPMDQAQGCRSDWLARCRVTVQQRNAYREIRAGAIELRLVVRNGGQATAGDVLAELRLDDEQYWLCRPDELETPPMPKPPPKPSPSAIFDYSRSVVAQPLDPTLLQNLGGNDTWSFSKDRHVASIHVPQVRHGGVDVTLPGLLLLSLEEKVARGGVTLHWRCLGAAPPVSDSGELQIMPRASDISRQ
jgi:hypothetical protein